jgi:hypothetical protein
LFPSSPFGALASTVFLLGCGELSVPPAPRPPAAHASAGAASVVFASATNGRGASSPVAPDPEGLPKQSGPGPSPRVSVTAAPDGEQADLDPDNDLVVAPPAPLDGCAERLARARIAFVPATLRLRKQKIAARQGRTEVVACGAEQVVTYLGGPAQIKYNGAPTLTCRMALALARFEELAQAQAQRHLGRRISSFRHLGTYSCRKMVRFDFVSEHSYANAIDIAEMVLDSGQRISVQQHFGTVGEPPRTREAEFLRSLARRAFDERLFSTVLTPYWDNLHKDHFHLDLARYRVDGARPND